MFMSVRVATLLPVDQLELTHSTLSLVATEAVAAAPDRRLEVARDAAALEVVRGYELALICLCCDDVEELAWYRERLRDARIAAGLGPVELAPPAAARRVSRL